MVRVVGAGLEGFTKGAPVCQRTFGKPKAKKIKIHSSRYIKGNRPEKEKGWSWIAKGTLAILKPKK